MAESDVWMCRITNEGKASRVSPRELRIIGADAEQAKRRAIEVRLESRYADDPPVDTMLKLTPDEIECMPLEDWERGQPWPSQSR